MGRALDYTHRLVLARRGVVDDAGVRLRHGIVGRILYGEQRHGYVLRAARPVSVGVLGRPLRQPGAQRGEAREAYRAGVGGLRLADKGPARLAVVRLDRGIHEAHVAERPVGREAALHLAGVHLLEPRQRLLDPGRAPAHALHLLLPESGDEICRVRWLAGALRVVDVE